MIVGRNLSAQVLLWKGLKIPGPFCVNFGPTEAESSRAQLDARTARLAWKKGWHVCVFQFGPKMARSDCPLGSISKNFDLFLFYSGLWAVTVWWSYLLTFCWVWDLPSCIKCSHSLAVGSSASRAVVTFFSGSLGHLSINFGPTEAEDGAGSCSLDWRQHWVCKYMLVQDTVGTQKYLIWVPNGLNFAPMGG